MAYPASSTGHEQKWYTRAQAAAETQSPQPCLVALFSYSYVECPILVYGLRQALGACKLQHGHSMRPKQVIYAQKVVQKRVVQGDQHFAVGVHHFKFDRCDDACLIWHQASSPT